MLIGIKVKIELSIIRLDFLLENLRDDVNLSMDPDARLRASELCPSEYGHAEVNSRRVNGIEPSMQLELLRDAFGLGNSHHVESELLKDMMVSEGIGLGQHLSIDRLVAKPRCLEFLPCAIVISVSSLRLPHPMS